MPTLEIEPRTASDAPDPRAIPGTWSVAQVKTQEEHAVARRLWAFGIASFLPCVELTRIYPKRKVVVQQPVFRGYLCVAWQQDLQRGDILSARGVYGLKRVLDQGRFVRDLEQLAELIRKCPTLDTTEEIPVGRNVRIIRGPFLGTEGVYDERRKKGTLVVGCIALPGGAVIEDVDLKDVELI